MKHSFMKSLAILTCGALFAPLALAGCAPEGGAAAQDGVLYELNDEKTAYTVVDTQDFDKTEFTIPATFKGLPVTAIGEKAFSGCKSLESLVIPATVTEIGSAALKGCKSLGELTIPFVGASADATGEEALFGYLFGSKAFSNSSKVYQTAGGDEFKAYIPNNLVSVTVTGVGAIKEGAFSSCEFIETVVIEAAASVGEDAFLACDGLTAVYIGSAAVAAAVTEREACGGLCANANFIAVGENITNVGGYITSALELQGGTVTVGSKAYKVYGAHEEGGAYYRKEAAGYELIGLSANFTTAELKIPASIGGTAVVSVKASACTGKTNLTTVYAPASVTSIGVGAFRGCAALETVYIASPEIAQNVQNASAFGSLLYYAKDVYIASSIENVSEYIVKAYDTLKESDVTVDGISYNHYFGTEMTFRMEAEYAVFTGKNNTDGTESGGQYAFVRGNPAASNGQYVGNMNVTGNTVIFTFRSSVATRATFVICIASNQNPNGNTPCGISQMYTTCTINGQDIEGYSNLVVTPSEAASKVGSYVDFVRLELEIELAEGENTIVFTAGGATNNLDYIELIAKSTLTWTPKTDNAFKQND